MSDKMIELDRLMTGEEATAMLREFVCKCGFRLDDSEACFRKVDDGFEFECPQCGEIWVLREAGKIA